MAEVNNIQEQKKKAKDPFIYFDRCGAIIKDMDYNEVGRLTYMPYKGIDNGNETNPNKVINAPDEFTEALAYNTVGFVAINNPMIDLNNDLKIGSINNAIDNAMYILEHKINSEIATHCMTVFNSGLRSVYYPFITEDQRYVDHNITDHFVRDCGYLRFIGIFERDVYEKNCRAHVPDNREPITDINEIAVKAQRITSEFIADIAKFYDRAILEVLNILDIHRFAEAALTNMGLDRSQVSEDNDYAYCSSVLHERASYDLAKIAELVQLTINHAYYEFCKSYMAYSSYYPKKELVDNNLQKSLPYGNPHNEDVVNTNGYIEFTKEESDKILKDCAHRCAQSSTFRKEFTESLLEAIENRNSNN